MRAFIILLTGFLLWATALPLAVQAREVDFTLRRASGGLLRLADFRGRVVIIDFFATYCRPCAIAWPRLNRLLKHNSRRGLSVIGFGLDREGAKLLLPYAVHHNMQFPVVLGNLPLAKRLVGLRKLPSTLVVGPQGQELARFEGLVPERRLLSVVSPYLRSDSPAAPASALVHRPRQGQRRLRELWVTLKAHKGGEPGLMVHVAANVVDLAAEQGLWLKVSVSPEARSVTGLTPLGRPKRLYHRIADNSQDYFMLFISNDQLPEVPLDGVFRLSVSLLGPGRRLLEHSGDMVFSARSAGID